MLVKRSGAGSSILPVDVASVEDLPADLALALDHGYKILAWQENLQEEEMPPRWMWHLDWELEEWFKEIELIRKSKYGGETDDREEVDMMKNSDPEINERFRR